MTKSSRIYVGRWLIAEAAGVLALLGLLSRMSSVRAGLLGAAAVLAIVAIGRFRRRQLSTWTATAITWSARSKRTRVHAALDGAALIDGDGVVAVLELGPAGAVVTTGRIRLPDVASWSMISRGGPAVHLQFLILSTPTSMRALLAFRAAAGDGGWHPDALPAALESAVRRASRRLRADRIERRRLTADELATVTGAAQATTEAWDHVRVDGAVQVAVRVPLGAAGMTTEMLVRLTASPLATTAVTWSGNEATVRVDATDRATANRALERLAGTEPLIRLDGEQIRGRRATLALAVSPSPPSAAHRLSLPPSGVRIGVDRDGNPLCIRLSPQTEAPIGVTVIGGPAAAQSIAASAAAVGVRVAGWMAGPVAGVTEVRLGVPLRIAVLDRPTSSDAATLRDADVVVCQPLSVAVADAVATALGLSAQTAGWLTRIENGMVAVIADGRVRWAMLPAATEGVSGVGRS